MAKVKLVSPLKRSQALELYFMEHRAKVIDIAAFLDRVDRAADDAGGADDFRLKALREAIKILLDDKAQRARRVLELLSDPTTDPIPKAGMKGALGAYQANAAKPSRPTGARR